ncbi:hypothetical protein [Xanthomonas translucens]|uniref:hypothetical protein n=1 Tax=Xanthomonas campestris pv. translucens TaxID=343 RepID=UPI001F511D43|nr:hypothetical protein [Xanthomonas translucens]
MHGQVLDVLAHLCELLRGVEVDHLAHVGHRRLELDGRADRQRFGPQRPLAGDQRAGAIGRCCDAGAAHLRRAALGSIQLGQALLVGLHGGGGSGDFGAQPALMRDQVTRADPCSLQARAHALQRGLLLTMSLLQLARHTHRFVEVGGQLLGRYAGGLDLLRQRAHGLPLAVERGARLARERDLLAVGAHIALLRIELSQRVTLLAQRAGHALAAAHDLFEGAGDTIDGRQDDLQAQIIGGRHLGGLVDRERLPVSDRAAL